MCPSGNARRRRVGACALLVVGAVVAYRSALATPSGAVARATSIIGELEAAPTDRELTAQSLARARQSLARAEAEAEPTRAAILGDTALEWAEVARDLARAGAAERASDRLEQEASALQTELARLRAAVEQAMARVGEARHALQAIEHGKSPSAAPAAPAPATPAPAKPASAPSAPAGPAPEPR